MTVDAPAHVWVDRYRANFHMVTNNMSYIKGRLYGLSLPAPQGTAIIAKIEKLVEDARSINEEIGLLQQRMRTEYREQKRREQPGRIQPE